MSRALPPDDPAAIPSTRSLTVGALEPRGSLEVTSAAPQRPMQSLTAAAVRVTTETLSRLTTRPTSASEWQSDAWEMYDLIGEQRYLANVLGGRASQARFFVGRLSHQDVLADPEPVDDPALQNILDSVGLTAAGRAQLVQRAFINYFIGGEVYLVGIPRTIMDKLRGVSTPAPVPLDIDSVSMDQLEWRALSMQEVEFADRGRVVRLKLPETQGAFHPLPLDQVYLIRSWRMHPARGHEADSPTRSSLPVLRELVSLTMMVGAQTDSRLAGAGVFIVPDEARRAMLRAMGKSEDSDENPLADALIEAMSTAISDRSSAASFTPLVLTVPGDQADKFRHISFSTPFDKETQKLRDEAIRRLALGQDAPPEILLGMGSLNHWGAWLTREDTVTTHIEPPLAMLCDSLTTGLLRPFALAAGYAPDLVDELVVWYSVSHMVARPNRAQEAIELFDRKQLSGEALRDATGFDESDAPEQVQTDAALQLALDMVARAPSLAQAPGLEALYREISALLDGGTATAPDGEGAGEVEEVIPIPDTGEEVGLPADGPPREIGEPDAATTPPASVTAAAVRQHQAAIVVPPTEEGAE